MTRERRVAGEVEVAPATVDKRSRRDLLAGALGATGVIVAQAIARPLPVEAATNVHLGETNTSGHVTAIRTRSTGTSGTAIQGEVIATTPGSGSAGVRGKNKGSSTTSAGVRGSHSGAGLGVYGSSATGIGVRGTGGGMGVQGSSPAYGVFGYTTPDTGGVGVYGRGADGVRGRSYTGRAVVGQTDSGVGVYGEAHVVKLPGWPGAEIRHSNVAPASPEKVQVGVVSLPRAPGVESTDGAPGWLRSSR